MNNIKWFKTAKPNPTNKDFNVQLGVHFEEIAEMVEELKFHNAELPVYGPTFHASLLAMLKGVAQELKSGVMTASVKNSVEFLDSLVDQTVTADGVAYMAGYDMEGAKDEVLRSNWSKFDANGNALFDGNGKIIKGPDYFKPDLQKYVKATGE